MGLAFLGGGIFMALLQGGTTTFDWRSSRIVHTLTVASYRRRREYAFPDVASVGVKESYSEGHSYVPVIRLHSGETRWLSLAGYGYLSCAKVADDVCRATGLARHDTKGG